MTLLVFFFLAAKRKSDSLQDRIDALEREKEDEEQILEDAVLQVYISTSVLHCAGAFFTTAWIQIPI